MKRNFCIIIRPAKIEPAAARERLNQAFDMLFDKLVESQSHKNLTTPQKKVYTGIAHKPRSFIMGDSIDSIQNSWVVSTGRPS